MVFPNCPKCNEESTDELTGWCPVYAEPIINEECITGPDRQMCYAGCIQDFTYKSSKIGNILYCPQCEIFYNSKGNMIDWNSAIGLTDLYESDLKGYTDELLNLIGEYKESKTKECVSKKFYIEAIVYLHRHVGEQLRFLLIKRIKEENNIPLNSSDERFSEIVPLLKMMGEKSLIRLAFIYRRIQKLDKDKLLEFNKIRNKFVHSFNKQVREKILLNIGYLNSLIKSIQVIEQKLSCLVEKYKNN